jgi:hypothetical protein
MGDETGNAAAGAATSHGVAAATNAAAMILDDPFMTISPYYSTKKAATFGWRR